MICLKSYIFLPMLVDRQMDSTKGASADFLFYNVLIDSVDCGTIVFTIGIRGAGMEGLFDPSRSGRFPTMMP